MIDDLALITYEQVAEGLPRSLRRTIEAGMPCLGGGEHRWDAEDKGFLWRAGITDVTCYPERECLRCHVQQANPVYRPRGSRCEA